MSATPSETLPLACRRHDHQSCIEGAITTAAKICQAKAVKLTPLRRQVLALVWQSHKPLGAYTLIDMLAAADTRRVAPPTVYRALEFLLEHRLIHRIDSLNAYIGCPDPGHHHHNYFLICLDCGIAAECPTQYLSPAIEAAATAAGFAISSQSVEIVGRCPACRKHADA
ncbi:transcriptional repressor [Exilibacterium tricleocarpae]|uniref:Transcriptional repressor n=1 Tax=Exilibacterium tricleocarpae TaxID=2591008 RepID=A0A545T0L0_9GAMM|nr:Fur family transcriptional regulator [Exilibacterium tricleocarpae]TQV70731.1 transcriptional repressor [Exilibacterium tricleocarpae]